MKTIILACLCVFVAASPNKPLDARTEMGEIADSDVDVIGGSEAVPHAHPWQVSLQTKEGLVKWTHFCGGSLISENRVVTAAHCIDAVKHIKNSRVVAGEHDLTKNEGTEQIREIESGFKHPKYIPKTADWDYAVITTVENFTLNQYVQTIELAEEEGDLPEPRCNATGWGVFKQPVAGNEFPSILQQIDLPFNVPRSYCLQKYPHLTDRMMCAGGEPNRGLCIGDSGGPLVCEEEDRKFLAGIASHLKCSILRIVSRIPLLLYLQMFHLNGNGS